jgi:uncharacterized protein (DUF1778 family)
VSTSPSQRFEFRIPEAAKSRIQRAAELEHVSLSEFIRTAAEGRADEVLRTHSVMLLPSDVFDAVYSALDGPVEAIPALARAAQRAPTILDQA